MAIRYSDLQGSTDYPAGTQTNLGLGGYGFTPAQIQALKDAGVTYGQLTGLGLNTAPQTTISSGSGYSGAPGGGQSSPQMTQQGKDQMRSANMLGTMLTLGSGQQRQQGTPQGSTVSDLLQGHPEYGLSALGAAASTAAGMPEQMIINPTPSGTPNIKSGVGTVGGVQASSDIVRPGVANWNTVAQNAGLSQRDIAAFQQQGLTPNDIARRFNVAAVAPGTGVATPTQPGIFSAAPMPQATAARPTTAAAAPPATAAAYSPVAVPFAQAPPAPALDLGAHTSALENAGRAMYAHFGGDPNTATHADIANFHSQLAAGMGGGAAGSGGFPPQRGSTSEPIAQPAKKLATGGLVPGRGNKDSVPALLTPGEYVIPKEQVQQLIGRAPVRMQSGGFVSDDDPNRDTKRPPETRRKMLTTQSSSSAPAAQPSQATSSSAQSSSPPAAPGGGLSTDQIQQLADLYQQRHALTSGGASGGGYNIPGGGGYIGASPGVGQSGYAYPNQAAATAAGDVGVGAGGGTSAAAGAAGAVGGLASGLASAAKAYADSIKSWQVQPSAIPGPDSFKQQPSIQLQQS